MVIQLLSNTNLRLTLSIYMVASRCLGFADLGVGCVWRLRSNPVCEGLVLD